jgi:hypothetical protein
MGKLLLISLGCTLLASLVFIPALLSSLRSPLELASGAGRGTHLGVAPGANAGDNAGATGR